MVLFILKITISGCEMGGKNHHFRVPPISLAKPHIFSTTEVSQKQLLQVFFTPMTCNTPWFRDDERQGVSRG